MNFTVPSWLWFLIALILVLVLLLLLGIHVRVGTFLLPSGDEVTAAGKGWARNCYWCP